MGTEYTRRRLKTNTPPRTLEGMRISRALAVTAVVLSVSAVTAGCATARPGATPPPSAPAGAAGSWDGIEPNPPTGEVIGQGTVMDVDGVVELCLGGILESYPPQCSGVPLTGWSWEGVEGAETSGTTTWGAYAVQGTYDGASLEVTAPPILLALYDPARPDDPTNGEPGPADEATLESVQEDVHERLGARALSSWPQDGRLWVQVVWDDGTLQDAADATWGDDVVVVQSALHEIG